MVLHLLRKGTSSVAGGASQAVKTRYHVAKLAALCMKLRTN